MRLSIRIISLAFLGIIILLAIDGYLSVRREVELFDRDMATDALHVGRKLRELVARTWETQGESYTLEFLERLSRDDRTMRVRWTWLDEASAGSHVPALPLQALGPVLQGQELSLKDESSHGVGHRYTYVPINVTGGRIGALEISEPLDELRVYTRETVFRSLALGGFMALLGLGLLWVFGVRMIGRPLDLLVEKTERISDGDFSDDLVLRGRDELSSLAEAVNRMCRHLAAARNAIRKENEAKLIALDQMRHSERLAMMGRISSGIAHEMGTPLNVVSGRAKMIAAGTLAPEGIVASAQIIHQQADRMTRIIRQLLDFVRRPTRQRHRERMDSLARNVLDLLRPTAEKANVTLDLAVLGELPEVSVDRSQVEQVLMNLLMNAIQAMSRGGSIRIEIEAVRASCPSPLGGREQDCVVTRVVDEGEGIPVDNLKLVFEPFFSTKQAGRGTGLGLSIVKEIVEEHGGRIDVTSEVGKGTCFAVHLPVEEPT